jgi:quercetin dioxygenase-like cupin family protein
MENTRREFVLSSLMAAFAARALAQQEATAQQKKPITSQAVPFDQIPVRTAEDGRESRPCVDGVTPNVGVEMHQTKLPPGKMPHPPHRHAHDELFLIRTGTATVTIAGKATTLGPGGYAIITGNDEHGIKNTGDVPAEYFVVALRKPGSPD